jgi:hypothetical protein
MSLDSHPAVLDTRAGPAVSGLSPELRFDARILRGVEALAAVPRPHLRHLTPGDPAHAFASPLAAAAVLSALAALPSASTAEVVAARARYLVDALRPPGGWPFDAQRADRWAIDLDTTVCALAALSASAPGRGGPAPLLVALGRDAGGGGSDLGHAANVLHWSALLGLERPELAARVVRLLAARGLAAAGDDAARYPSPFVRAYLLARWLRLTRAHGDLEARLADEIAASVRGLLGEGPPDGALECAAALVSLFDLGAVSAAVHPLAERVWEQQGQSGLWEAALYCVAGGTAFGSAEITSAICLEALYKYSRGGAALFRSSPARGRDGAGGRGRIRTALGGPRATSLDHMLAAVAPCLPPALVSGEALSDLRSTARGLPYAVAHGFGLECRLGEETARADLALLIQPGDGREILAGRHAVVPPPGRFFEHAVWRRVRDFCGDWAEPDSAVHRHVEGLWLEFDVDGPPEAVPVPSVFLALRDRGTELSPGELSRVHHELARGALASLWGRPLPEGVAATLAECFRAVPAGADLFSMAVMLSRPWDVVRLGVKNVSAEGLLSYLSRVGWPGPRPLLERWLRELEPLVDRFFLDLDVGAEVLPTFGLECILRRPPTEEPRWRALLERLEREGLCRPDKRRGLLAWPGPFYAEETVDGDVWTSGFDLFLSHVKLGVGMSGRLEAKAYLGAWQSYSDRREAPPPPRPRPAARHAVPEAAVTQAWTFLEDSLVTGRCRDAWHARAGAPPIPGGDAIFLDYFAARALAAGGRLTPLVREVIRTHLSGYARGEAYGYNRIAPPDADDTAFALRTRVLLGEALTPEAIARSLAPFARRGSWLTFPSTAVPVPGWTIEHRHDASTFGLHPEVHLNVLALLREAGQAAAPPPDLPRRDGLYAAYHYPSRLYATWLAAEVLRGGAAEGEIDAAVLAAQRADGSWSACHGGFSAEQETALAVLSLSDAALATAAGRRALAFLLARQQPDGSWPGGILWQYHKPGTGGTVVWWADDARRIVSTALGALAVARAAAAS